jgi:proteasome activator subunit 4
MDGTIDISQSPDPSSEAFFYTLQSFTMEEEDVSTTPDSPTIESTDLPRQQAAMEKQRASLKTYLSSLPYDAESEEDMHARLEFILGRMAICAEAKNWLVLATWDGVLQWYACATRRMPISTKY